MSRHLGRALALVAAVAVGWWVHGGRADAAASDGGVYVVAQIQIDDRETYRKYEAGFGEIFRKYQGKSVGFSEDPELIEGEWPYTRTVLLWFPSSEALHDWYDSPEYQKIAEHRWAASKANVVAVPGR